MQTNSIIKPPTSKKIKSGRVVLSPNEEVGEHVTEKREELLVILRGEATIILDSECVKKTKGETHFVPEGITHNVKNLGEDELEYIYVVNHL